MTTRSRDWRRFQKRIKAKAAHPRDPYAHTYEKNWKLLYTRRVKLRRAKTLGKDYPKLTITQLLEQYE